MTTKFFERPQSGERATLVHASPDGLPDESEREEFAELARSAGAELVGELEEPLGRGFPGSFREVTKTPVEQVRKDGGGHAIGERGSGWWGGTQESRTPAFGFTNA